MTDIQGIPDYGVQGSQGAQTTPAPVPDDLETPEIAERSPILAGILSILPGAGQIYLGKLGRGISYLALFLTMVGLVHWAQNTPEFEPSQVLIAALIGLIVLFWIWVMFAAVTAATRRMSTSPALGLLIVLFYTYSLGWQVIDPNMQKFFTEFDDTFNIFRRVIWPWNVAVERPEEFITVGTNWASPCPDDEADLPPQAQNENEPWVMVGPTCGEFTQYVVEEGRGTQKPGTEITVIGGGFDPGASVQIFWKDPIGNEFPVRFEDQNLRAVVEEDGSFEVTFETPTYSTPSGAVGAQFHEIQARQVESIGGLQLSENVELAFGRMVVTIFQALMATSLGIVLAVPVSFLAARNLMWGNAITRFAYYLVRFILNVTRSIEPIIWAVIAVVWVGLGPFAGVLALMVHTVASLAKLYSEAIESIDPGPIEAITATGANRLQMIMYAIIPQVIPPFLSFTIYRWDINVRMSTIIGFVGGGGIGQLLFQWIGQTKWSEAGIAVWMIAVTVTAMDYASSELRKRFI